MRDLIIPILLRLSISATTKDVLFKLVLLTHEDLELGIPEVAPAQLMPCPLAMISSVFKVAIFASLVFASL